MKRGNWILYAMLAYVIWEHKFKYRPRRPRPQVNSRGYIDYSRSI